MSDDFYPAHTLAEAEKQLAEHRAQRDTLKAALEALETISREPKGHDCRGYCRRMYGIAIEALNAIRRGDTDHMGSSDTRLTEALAERDNARRERDEVYAVNAAAANDRARRATDALEEIAVLCERGRIPLPLLNSQILRVVDAALAAARADAPQETT